MDMLPAGEGELSLRISVIIANGIGLQQEVEAEEQPCKLSYAALVTNDNELSFDKCEQALGYESQCYMQIIC